MSFWPMALDQDDPVMAGFSGRDCPNGQEEDVGVACLSSPVPDFDGLTL